MKKYIWEIFSVGICLVAVAALFAQAPVATKSVSGFAGSTLNDRILAAQVGCTVMAPCNIIIDVVYPRVLGEMLPANCMGCTRIDNRVTLITPILAGDVITQLPDTLNVKDLTPNASTIDILDVDVPTDQSTYIELIYYVSVISDSPSAQNSAAHLTIQGINFGGTVQCNAIQFGENDLFSSDEMTRTWTAMPGTDKCIVSLFTKSGLPGTITEQRLKYYILNISGFPIVRD